MNIKIGKFVGSARNGVAFSRGLPLDVMLGAAINTLTIPQIMAGLGGWMQQTGAGAEGVALPAYSHTGDYTCYVAFSRNWTSDQLNPGFLLRNSGDGTSAIQIRLNGGSVWDIVTKHSGYVGQRNAFVSSAETSIGVLIVAISVTASGMTIRSNASAIGNRVVSPTSGTVTAAYGIDGPKNSNASKMPLLAIYSGAHSNATMDAVIAGGLMSANPVYLYCPPIQGDYNGTAVRTSAGQATITDNAPATFWTVDGNPVVRRPTYDYLNSVLYLPHKGGVFGSVNGDTLSLAGLRAAPNPNTESFAVIIASSKKVNPTAGTVSLEMRNAGVGFSLTRGTDGTYVVAIAENGSNAYQSSAISDETICFSWNHLTNTFVLVGESGSQTITSTSALLSISNLRQIANANSLQFVSQRFALIPQALSLAQCQAVIANRTIAGYTPEIDIRPNDCDRTDNQVCNFGSLGGFATLTDQTTSDWRGQRLYRQDRMIL